LQISLQVFTPKTALGTVRIRETLPGTCPRMLRSETGCKTEIISRKERKTYFLPPFAISQNSQGSEVFSPAYTPYRWSLKVSSGAGRVSDASTSSPDWTTRAYSTHLTLGTELQIYVNKQRAVD
jgi:hypothetical protein